jgi:hypothetical protein
VNPAIHAAIIAATQQEAVKEKVEDKLREARALGASSAAIFDPADEAEQKLLDAAISSGNVVRTLDGRVYLNERAVSDRQEGQGYMALLIILVIASVIASVAVLATRAGG